MFYHQIVVTLVVKLLITYVKLETCQKTLSLTVEECLITNSFNVIPSPTCTKPSSDKTCQKRFNLTAITKEPYYKLLPFLLQRVFRDCCGDCVKSNITQRFGNSSSFTEALENNELEDTSLAFPILYQPTKGVSLYNRYFIPMIEIDGAILVTPAIDTQATITELLMSALNLWPLLLITLLMAVIAGFLGWILDTWKNEEEFPRPFLQGLFHGFWWSFVSMTTVGYGDKSPRSVMARLFAVFWILNGITMFSMLTASLTAAIAEASDPPEPSIVGNKIGILKDRMFEQSFVVRDGGTPIVSDTIEDLISKLQNKEIFGFLLDKITSIHYQHQFEQLQKTYKIYNGEKMAYGVLLFGKADYDYFSPFLKDNSIMLETCILAGLGARAMKLSERTDVFAVEGGLFVPALVSLLIIVIFVLIFGLFYEIKRKKTSKTTEITPENNNENSVQMVIEYDLISEIEDVIKRWQVNEKHIANNAEAIAL